MMPFVDLQRRFRDLTLTELEDPELLAFLNEHEFGPSIGWSELLQSDRVLLLAEAGSGKTCEMREQAKRLVEKGRFAFFVAIESLYLESLASLLPKAEKKRLADWKADGKATAWFFLDAVDELKLRQGTLDQALQRLGLPEIVWVRCEFCPASPPALAGAAFAG